MAEAAAPDVGRGLEAGVGQGPLRPGEVAVGRQGRLPRTPEVATADTLRPHPRPVHPRRHQGLLVKMKVKEVCDWISVWFVSFTTRGLD